MKSFGVFAALVACVKAVALSNSNFDVVAGSTFTISWFEASGPVTLDLRNGASGDLIPVSTIASGQSSVNGIGSFAWNVPTSINAQGPFAIVITDSSGVNYSPQFQIAGLSTASTTTAKTTTTTAASTTATTTATTTGKTSTTTTAASTTTGKTTTASSTESTTSTTTAASSTSTTAVNSVTSSFVPTSSKTMATSTKASTTSEVHTPSTVPQEGAASSVASPLGLVAMSVAALFFLL